MPHRPFDLRDLLTPAETPWHCTVQKGCRVRLPAEYYCIEVEPQNVHEVSPPYNPAQWTVNGPEPGERLCYKLKCPAVPPKDLAIIDSFGTRTVTLLGKTSFFCTSVTRQLPPNGACSLAGTGVCGGTCPPGQTCFATGEDCTCLPDSQACASASSCQDGFCLGVWETCMTLPIGGCGCSHP